MPTWLIEVEDSTLNTYRVHADNETNARMIAMSGYGDLQPIEEHEQQRITSCVQEAEDD